MTYLALALAAPDTTAARRAMRLAVGRADLVELRLDLMHDFDLPRLLARRPRQVIVTCRPRREGGRWQGSEVERLDVLRQAAALGADYVDLEWDAAEAISTLDRSRTRVILSRHDFAAMPADLAAQAKRLWQAGPDVVKVAGMAQRLADCAPVLRLLAEAQRPTIAIAMGRHGLPSRVLAFRYANAFLSFAAPDEPGAPSAAGTALGQLTLSAMRDLYRVHAIDGRTRFVGLVAADADALPALAEGNRWLGREGYNAVLAPLPLAPGEDPAAALAAIQLDASVILSGFAGQPTPASVILSGSAGQPTPAGESSEESLLPTTPVIIAALRRLLDGAPGASADG